MKRIRQENINTTEYWNKVYASEAVRGRKRIYDELWQEMIQVIPDKDIKLVDVGCGGGQLLHYLSIYRPSLNLYGTDFSEEAVNLAKKICQKAQILLCTEELFPFREKSFDYVICSEVPEHVENPKLFVKRICALLKPKGHLITTTPWKWGASDPEHVWDFEKPEDIVKLDAENLELIDSTIANNGRTMVVLAQKRDSLESG